MIPSTHLSGIAKAAGSSLSVVLSQNINESNDKSLSAKVSVLIPALKMVMHSRLNTNIHP